MSTAPSRHKIGEPAWEIAQIYPDQGQWDEEEYLSLDTNRLVEFSDGVIEVLAMPTTTHQAILLFLYRILFSFVEAGHLGRVSVAALKVRIGPRKYREPDIVFMLAKHAHRIGEQFWQGADLVMEVVSADPESRNRDLVKKRREYARGRIPEYWLVDPQKATITVLKLSRGKYVVHGTYRGKDKARSVVLPGFEVDVDAVFKAK